MSEKAFQRRGRRAKNKIKSHNIQDAALLRQIIGLLAPLHDHRPGPKRRLHYDEYCAWFLLYYFNPILTTLRGLQKASDILEYSNVAVRSSISYELLDAHH